RTGRGGRAIDADVQLAADDLLPHDRLLPRGALHRDVRCLERRAARLRGQRRPDQKRDAETEDRDRAEEMAGSETRELHDTLQSRDAMEVSKLCARFLASVTGGTTEECPRRTATLSSPGNP